MNTQVSTGSICYKKNFLTDVVARIDLVSPVKDVSEELPKDISMKILKYFPIDEPKEAIRQSILVDQKGIQSTQEKFKEWNFYGRDREKIFKLTKDFFFISYSKYETFEGLRNEFVDIANEFFKKFEEAQPSRIGLRYINEINLAEANPLAWSDYIDSSLLGLFSYQIEGAKPARIFHNFELIFDDFNLRFQFGIHNPDYPAPIRTKIFILDYDAYFKGLIEASKIELCIDRYHETIQKMFESNITQKIRDLLNE